jgi:hypothetical protein
MSARPSRRRATSHDRIWWLVILTCLLLAVALAGKAWGGEGDRQHTVEGKPVSWWAARAKQARKDANARAQTIRLATIAYPDFTEQRAWRIIRHESWMVPDPIHAYNTTSVNGCHATGLYQFLDCTFRSTPYGKAGLSIYSPYAQSLAAGYMHEVGRGCEWDIDC